jgi:hypothetical protein
MYLVLRGMNICDIKLYNDICLLYYISNIIDNFSNEMVLINNDKYCFRIFGEIDIISYLKIIFI